MTQPRTTTAQTRLGLTEVARNTPPTADGCRQILSAMRAHGRPMSLSLIRSRVPGLSVQEVAACLWDLISDQEEVGIEERGLFELEHP